MCMKNYDYKDEQKDVKGKVRRATTPQCTLTLTIMLTATHQRSERRKRMIFVNPALLQLLG